MRESDKIKNVKCQVCGTYKNYDAVAPKNNDQPPAEMLTSYCAYCKATTGSVLIDAPREFVYGVKAAARDDEGEI